MLNQLIKNAQPYWQQYVEHDFVKQLACGTLPPECFRHYLKQDYLYLFHYSRAFALAIFKAKNFSQMETPRKNLKKHNDILPPYPRNTTMEILHVFVCKNRLAPLKSPLHLLWLHFLLPHSLSHQGFLCYRLRTHHLQPFQ